MRAGGSGGRLDDGSAELDRFMCRCPARACTQEADGIMAVLWRLHSRPNQSSTASFFLRSPAAAATKMVVFAEFRRQGERIWGKEGGAAGRGHMMDTVVMGSPKATAEART